MTDMPATPSWQPDPSGRHQHRYWDGTAWTDNVADDGVSSTDPWNPTSAAPESNESPWSATQVIDPSSLDLSDLTDDPPTDPANMSTQVIDPNAVAEALAAHPSPEPVAPAAAPVAAPAPSYDPAPQPTSFGSPPASTPPVGGAIATAAGSAPESKGPSKALLIGGALIGLLVIGALVWFFVLRDSEAPRDLVAEQARAEAAVLMAADLSPGFTAMPEESDDELGFEGPACERLLAARLSVDGEPEASSDRFDRDDSVSITSFVGISTTENVEEYLAAFDAESAIPCLESELVTVREELPDGIEVGAVSVVRGTAPDLGDGSSSLAATIELTDPDGSPLGVVSITTTMVRVDSSLAVFQFNGVGTALDEGRQADLISIVVDRLRATAP